MKLFDKALLKLTAIYTAILLLLSLGFSFIMYTMTANGMDRRPDFDGSPDLIIRTTLDYGTPENPDVKVSESADGFEDMIRERDAAIRSELLTGLVAINLSVISVGAIVSYFLARRTLKPIHEAYEMQVRFVSDASHELRTPLTAISMENEVLLRSKKVSKDDLAEQVESNLEEIKKLQKLTDCLLQLDGGKRSQDKKMVLEQVVNILVENAVKYDPEHRQPEIVRGKNRIDVVDKGVGISEEDLPHIFERFYRAEKSRTSEGYGLGLALAQKLAGQIGAKIEVKNNSDKGATFSIILS